jgi:hypothetical protein
MSWRLQPGSQARWQAAIAWNTASWCLRPAAPWPERQVAHARSRGCLGARYQSRRQIRRVRSIWSPQPGPGQRPAGSKR